MSTAKHFCRKFTDSHPLPRVITTLTQLINDDKSTMKDFEEVIKVDPVLVSRLLRLVNSAYFAPVHPVDSVGRAIALLGMKNLHNLVIADALRDFFSGKDTDSVFSKKQLWVHSAAVSICSKMIAERIFAINGDDAFLCGILHDFGLLIEDQVEQKKFREMCRSCTTTDSLIQKEQQLFGTDHSEISYTMTLEWNMSTAIQETLRDHHLIADHIDPTSLTGIVQIAEYIVGKMDYPPLPGIQPVISPQLTEHIHDNIEEYTVLIDDLPEEIAKAQLIYG
ncbi:MAG: HDOD domain-containing protein [Desulforhopalus sp.]